MSQNMENLELAASETEAYYSHGSSNEHGNDEITPPDYAASALPSITSREQTIVLYAPFSTCFNTLKQPCSHPLYPNPFQTTQGYLSPI